jgi:alkylation response protein AidB-like acyl-CoA dehydrogenase
MNFQPDPRISDFREEVRTFLSYALQPAWRERKRKLISSPKEDVRAWSRALDEREWLVHDWPFEYGGQPWSAGQRYVFEEELAMAYAPDTDRIALGLIGPVLCKYGTEEQRARYLPAIRNADEFWCQGFSEPHCGSDLSGIRTTAARDGDNYVVDGRKLWITSAQISEMMFALVKTTEAGKPTRGLSFLLIDMRQPGVTVNPIITLDGSLSDREMVNEVILEGVAVPTGNLIGDEGKGWLYARSLLAHERSIVPRIAQAKRDLATLREIAQTEVRNERPLLQDPIFRAQLISLEAEFSALEFLYLRMLHLSEEDSYAHVLAPTVKIRGASFRQRISELMLEALGENGIKADGSGSATLIPPYAEGVGANYLFRRTASIAGGTSEIQRNIIAAVGLEL